MSAAGEGAAAHAAALVARGRYAEAALFLRPLCKAAPDDAALASLLGTALFHDGRPEEAGPFFKTALRCDPQREGDYALLAQCFLKVRNFPSAVGVLDQARDAGVNSVRLLGLSFYLRQSLADWTRFDTETAALRAAAADPESPLDPAIGYLVPGLDHRAQYAIAARQARALQARVASLPPAPLPDRRDRLRIGYLSADFWDHPVGRHIVGVLAHHDRDRFAVFLYDAGRNDGSAVAARLRATGTTVDVSAMPDDVAAARIRADGIDLLIDLGGYTENARTAIPLFRSAPVQALYLGCGGTSGGAAHDAIIADPVTVPGTHEVSYSERPALLPATLFNVDHGDAPPPTAPARASVGLPRDAFVFCAFNNTWKIMPGLFDVWVELLRAVPNSVLWLRKYYPGASAKLTREAGRRGIAPDRLIFAAPIDRQAHLARLACADLALDTVPYGAGSTAADCLWAGVPLLTCCGETYVGRMGAGQVAAVGLSELAAPSLPAYRDMALALARDPARLAVIRSKLAAVRRSSKLFDTASFTRDLEDLYAALVRTRSGSRPGV